jgi:pimeloyl-ACP methyl ester carboxylesterase
MSQADAEAASPTFVLVHGAMHGSWCWEHLRSELDHLGGGSIAMDLSIDDLETEPLDYAKEVAAYVGERTPAGPTVVVGHSQGGFVVPLLPAVMSVDAIIYVCAALPAWLGPRLPGEPEMLTIFAEGRLTDEVGRILLSPHAARRVLFHDCPEHLQDWAVSRLRGQNVRWLEDVLTTAEPPVDDIPEVPIAYVVTTGDQSLNPDWQRFSAISRLRCPYRELIGSGHSPFLSRPAELAGVLMEIAHELL